MAIDEPPSVLTPPLQSAMLVLPSRVSRALRCFGTPPRLAIGEVSADPEGAR